MKRNLFDELNEGFQALASERQGKLTLKQHAVTKIAAPVVHSGELLRLRQKLNVSQAVFAQYLRINKRTLENWEQGRVKPNAQAAVLIKMVEKYPDTLERLDSV
ncbi:MAG: helix-turn-helix domain-containing protein [Pseudomonadota bacterium]